MQETTAGKFRVVAVVNATATQLHPFKGQIKGRTREVEHEGEPTSQGLSAQLGVMLPRMLAAENLPSSALTALVIVLSDELAGISNAEALLSLLSQLGCSQATLEITTKRSIVARLPQHDEPSGSTADMLIFLGATYLLDYGRIEQLTT